MARAVGRPGMSFPQAPPRTTHPEGAAMASPTARASNALKLERSCERSRLEKQVLAAAYELLTPLLRQPIPTAAPDRQQTATRPAAAGRARLNKAGGSHP